MWQLSILCVVFSEIYAREIPNKIFSPLTTQSDEDGNDVGVVGGRNIDIKDAPYQVSMVLEGFGHNCGGSIIAEDIILTAAHCVDGFDPSRYQIRVGASLYESGGLLIPVTKLIQHSKYNSIFSFDYDIGLVKLSTPLEFSDTVKPVVMMNEGEEIADGAMANVTGWGSIKSNKYWAPVTLQEASVQITNDEVCRSAHAKMGGTITPRMLCTSSPASDPADGEQSPCMGDSGGPLVHDGKLIGVVSFGASFCGDPNYPAVYTKVSALRSWIDKSIKHLTSSVN